MKNNLLQKNMPSGWSKKQFENCIILPSKLKGLKRSEYKTFGRYPIFDQAKEYISGFTDDENFLNNRSPAILFGDHTRILKYIKSPFVLGADGTKVFWSKEDIDSMFLYYSMLNIKIPNTGYNRHFKFLKESYILIPKKDEQKKIAEILSKVDEEIEKVDELIEKTEKLKSGLMAELFTKGWKTVPLQDLCLQITGGGTPARNNPSYWNGNIPWVTVKDLDERKFIGDSQEYITNEGLENSSANLIPPHSIITSTRMGIGRFYITTEPVAINQDMKAIVPKESIDLNYLYYFLLSKAAYLQSKGTGTTVKGIKVDVLRQLVVPIADIEEQRKIGAYFSTFDKEIVINKNLKEKINQLKKGLMADLLSGRVRINSKK